MTLQNINILLYSTVLVLLLCACGNQDIKMSVAKENNTKQIETVKIQNSLQAKEEKIRQSIRDYLQQSNLSGVVAVVKGSHPIFNEGVGYADLDKKIMNQPSTTFPIGSVTKTFVSTSIMMLQEQGKLNIQDPVSKYIPDFPNGANLRLYHFLTHTSGIQALHWQKGDTTPQKLIQEIEKRPLKFQPGTKWDYLDANYIVLGFIVEKVTGMNLHDFIQTNILDKVPMKETGFITKEHPVPYTSVSYTLKDNKIEPTKYLSVYPLFACGDIYTTAYDLSQYDQALMNGRLISKDSLKQVLTPSPHSSYGLGLYSNKSMVYSIGVLGGWYSMHAYYPDKTSIVILLNARSKTTEIDLYTEEIYKILKGYDSQQIAQR
ncbi:serine hydrolase domain-containing protein [Bacillus sp. EB600]|uniref:serine hydrolase domain-containing protein n=1 Tax=Bacillus sp. EB600 TaxID=2806345 RepID=UPI00210A597E|nr:serine hydrolase domain-containing protein [Bacillus sp. EB600]MCQ6278280.1 beta-lactamase family protein [Bacillus sp. EB600]